MFVARPPSAGSPLIHDLHPPTPTQGGVDQTVPLNGGPVADAHQHIDWTVDIHHSTDMLKGSIAPVKRAFAKQNIVAVPCTARAGPGVNAHQQPLNGGPEAITSPPGLHRFVDGVDRHSHTSADGNWSVGNFFGRPKPPSFLVR